MIIHVPDTHVGRCTNLRQRFDSNGYPYFVRCVDYAATPHVCSFEPEPEPSPDSWGRLRHLLAAQADEMGEALTTVHLIDGTSREHPGCTGHSEDGRLWITSAATKCMPCDGNGGFKVDSMTLYGIPGGEDWGEMCADCRGKGDRPGIMCASYPTDEIDWWTDR